MFMMVLFWSRCCSKVLYSPGESVSTASTPTGKQLLLRYFVPWVADFKIINPGASLKIKSEKYLKHHPLNSAFIRFQRAQGALKPLKSP